MNLELGDKTLSLERGYVLHVKNLPEGADKRHSLVGVSRNRSGTPYFHRAVQPVDKRNRGGVRLSLVNLVVQKHVDFRQKVGIAEKVLPVGYYDFRFRVETLRLFQSGGQPGQFVAVETVRQHVLVKLVHQLAVRDVNQVPQPASHRIFNRPD